MVKKSKAHILVIEDEEDILELITYNLRKEGYEVTGVISGEEGLAQAANVIPDLVLCLSALRTSNSPPIFSIYLSCHIYIVRCRKTQSIAGFVPFSIWKGKRNTEFARKYPANEFIG